MTEVIDLEKYVIDKLLTRFLRKYDETQRLMLLRRVTKKMRQCRVLNSA